MTDMEQDQEALNQAQAPRLVTQVWLYSIKAWGSNNKSKKKKEEEEEKKRQVGSSRDLLHYSDAKQALRQKLNIEAN